MRPWPRASGRTDGFAAVGRDCRAAARSMSAPTQARRCRGGPGLSPGAVAKGGGVPARTQGAPRRSASAGRAGTGTRRRTGSRPARARRAQTPNRRREALRAPARRGSRRGPKAEGRSSLHSDARAAGCRRAIRPSDVGDPATMPAGISYGAGLARCAARNGHRRARWRLQVPLRRREDDWRRATCAVVGRCSPFVRRGAGLDIPTGFGGLKGRGAGCGVRPKSPAMGGARKIERMLWYRAPVTRRPAGPVHGRRRDAVRDRGGSGDVTSEGQDGLRSEWAMPDRGSRAGDDANTARDAQALERCRFRNACGHRRSAGRRSSRARPQSEWRQWVGWPFGRPSVAIGTYRARRAFGVLLVPSNFRL